MIKRPPTRSLLLLVLALGSSACSPKEEASEAPVRPVLWQRVEQVGGERSRVFSGSLRAGSESRLSFKVDGTLTELGVSVGDRVKKGSLIARLDTRDLALTRDESLAQLRRQEAQARNAASERDRAEGLYENDNTSLSNLQRAEAEHESARQGVRSAQSALARTTAQLEYTRLRAPVDGVISEVLVEQGENLRSGDAVALLASGSEPEVSVAIPGSLIARIRIGDEVVVRTDAVADEVFAGTVSEVGISATAGGTAFPVIARLTRMHPGLRLGMTAEVEFRFTQGDGSPRILVPPRAIAEDQGGRHAFVVRDVQSGQGRATRVAVETGEITGEGLEVRNGLAEGDVLVTAGLHALQDGQIVAVPES